MCIYVMCTNSEIASVIFEIVIVREPGVMVLMLSYLLPAIRWQYHTANPHSGVIVLMLSYLLPIRWQYHTANPHSEVDVVISATYQMAISHC